MSDYVEQGDVYFFYRPAIDADEVNSIDEIQRLFLVLAPDNEDRARLLVIGQKRLPEIIEGESKSSERGWMMNLMIAEPRRIGERLGPDTYETKTEGKRELSAAVPVGEGRYEIFDAGDSSFFAYRLTQPEDIGEAQSELGISHEASYVISVRNPSLDVSGFPDASPDYPAHLKNKFGDKRWIRIDDSELLDYEDAQLVLVGAKDDLSDTGADLSGKPDLFGTLKLEKRDWPTTSLKRGEFTDPTNHE